MSDAIKHVSADQYESLLEEKDFWNLDVREKYEFDTGYIKGALLVPSTRFEEEFEKLKISKNSKIGLYCRTGSRSAFIAEKLKDKGYKNIYNLEVGLAEWNGYGKKLTKDK